MKTSTQERTERFKENVEFQLEILRGDRKTQKTLSRINSLEKRLSILNTPRKPKKDPNNGQKVAWLESKWDPYIEKGPGHLRIALDTQVSNRAAEYLNLKGFNIVVRAQQAEPDNKWMQRAIDRNAHVVVANDRQVQFYAEMRGMLVVHCHDKDSTGKSLYKTIKRMIAEE